jgi:phosphocarrier protein HPr
VTEREVEIVNRLGLHARAAAKLVHTSSRFDSHVWLIKDGEEVDAKSILGLLLLAAAQGSLVTVRCEGDDEAEALEAVSELIADGFYEERSDGDEARDGAGRTAKPTEEDRS